jgi:hypothetical protein
MFERSGELVLDNYKHLIPVFKYPKLKIKPYQTLILSKSQCKQKLEGLKADRFLDFIERNHPNSDFEKLVQANLFTYAEIEEYVNFLHQLDLGILMNKISKFTILVISKDIIPPKLPVADHKFRLSYNVSFEQIFNFFYRPTILDNLKNHDLELKHFHSFILNGVLREAVIYCYKNPKNPPHFDNSPDS